MNSGLMFIGSVLILAAIIILRAYKSPAGAIRYFGTKEGKGVLGGILLFVLLGIAFVAPASFAAERERGTWFAYSEVFLGVDYTKDVSPQCYAGGHDDRATSNGGIRQNIFRSADRRFHLNAKYTHHSCAFNPDREGYDGLGAELSYRFFNR